MSGFTVLFFMELVQVMTDKKQKNLQFHRRQTPSHDTFVPTIIFQNAEFPFSLYGTIHPEKCSMYASKIVQHLTCMALPYSSLSSYCSE